MLFKITCYSSMPLLGIYLDILTKQKGNVSKEVLVCRDTQVNIKCLKYSMVLLRYDGRSLKFLSPSHYMTAKSDVSN